MKGLCTVIGLAILYWLAPVFAAEPIFVESCDQIVEQVLAGEKNFGLSRSFVVNSEETRSIKVRAKNKQGREETVVVEVQTNTINSGARLKLEFDVNSANIRSSAYPLLAELGKALQDERLAEKKICIKGHTDSDGDQFYNLQLSFDRATSVLNYLQSVIGISVDKLQVFGYGESMPLVANNSVRQKQTNRRVEISLNCQDIRKD